MSVTPFRNCIHEYTFPCFLVVNDVFTRPRLTKLCYKCRRIVKRFHGLDKMEVSVTLHLEDAKGQAQLTSDLGTCTGSLVRVSRGGQKYRAFGFSVLPT